MNFNHFSDIILLHDFFNTNLKITKLCCFDFTKNCPYNRAFQHHIYNIEDTNIKLQLTAIANIII